MGLYEAVIVRDISGLIQYGYEYSIYGYG
ncbi:hypothetical protein AvCA_08110 [Azotobacter vinelandii CA]|uniref:Uncharacterized protein n=2 Tax=Azotobacter vinelandii TaxID=354 RepID=C1DMM6_AZOVD|nr:hypothetical protein Avin_08110 [Azotobacter vinelandii DJ]AGK15507.1 hypothetical protein AvCA_08110 [Azotobacter vinelandii CA]AGK19530.1 hypothetical protein AvCA6_08110 [Azotobacter vinelandii CA6]